MPDLGYTVREDKRQQTFYSENNVVVTWKVKWTNVCNFDLLFDREENGDVIFDKGDRISVTITATDGECYAFKSIFYKGGDMAGREIPPGQMCRKTEEAK